MIGKHGPPVFFCWACPRGVHHSFGAAIRCVAKHGGKK
jgi:hypothetical protein